MKPNTKMILITAIIALASAGAGFFGGTKYQQAQATSRRDQAGNFFRMGAGNGQGIRFGNGRGVIGDIVSKDDKSITVKMADGSTKIVLLSVTTSINKASEGTKDDLKEGVTVAVFGMQNQDGSTTAQNIQINPRIPNSSPSATPISK